MTRTAWALLGAAATAGCVVVPLGATTRTGAFLERVPVRVRYRDREEIPTRATVEAFLLATQRVLPFAEPAPWSGSLPPNGCALELWIAWQDDVVEPPLKAGSVAPIGSRSVSWTRHYAVGARAREAGGWRDLATGEGQGTMSFEAPTPKTAPTEGAAAFSDARWRALRDCLRQVERAWQDHRCVVPPGSKGRRTLPRPKRRVS